MAEGVDTCSEAWRHECEVRHVVALPTKECRREYLEAVTKRRGETAGQRLRDDVRAAWLQRQRGPISPQGVSGAPDEALTTRPAGIPPGAGDPGKGPSPPPQNAGHSHRVFSGVHGGGGCSTVGTEGGLA